MPWVDAIILDGETKTTLRGKDIDGSPFNPDAFLSSMFWFNVRVNTDDPDQIKSVLKWIDDHRYGLVQHSIYRHVEVKVGDSREELQEALNNATIGIAHNAKFDIEWLVETGFALPETWWCTMIGEYVFCRGQGGELSLKASAQRRGVTAKKSDLIDELFDKGKGLGFHEMPLDTVIEYAEADVISCAEIWLHQLLDLLKPENSSLINVITLMNEMLMFLVDVECNGIAIDMDALLSVEEEYLAEQAQLKKDLDRIVEEVMGDTPINLASGVDMTKVIYSREMIDRKTHAEVWNIGTDAKGRKKYPPRMKVSEFKSAVRATTKVVYQTVAVCCPVCKGSGKVWKVKKNGERYKAPNKCSECGGAGAIYQPNGKVAGLKLSPESPRDATANGFAAGSDQIPRLLAQAARKDNLTAKAFLEKMQRLNAISAYLSNFINGIKHWTRPDGLLHPNFNQTIADTGRLSSSKPNFQNLPKGGRFPVRKAIVSRWADTGGEILEADFSGLEFRVAGELSLDTQIINDIQGGKDIHKQTASVINECPTEMVDKDMRQGAKAYCVPMDTEILTKDGWKTFSEVQVGESVLTYNQASDTTEWGPIRELVTFDDEEVVEVGNAQWSARTTPNHRWYGYTEKKGVKVPEIRTTEELGKDFFITRSAECQDEGDGIELYGHDFDYLIYAGRFGYRHLSPDDQVAAREVWSRSGLEREKADWVGLVLALSPDQRQDFVEAAYRDRGRMEASGRRVLIQNKGALKEAIKLAVLLNGDIPSDATSMWKSRRAKNPSIMEAVAENRKPSISCRSFREKGRTQEKVWCPRTDNGTWVMRQGKVITITGNTFAPLYGGTGANELDHVKKYFSEFFVIYKGLASYQKILCDTALKTGIIQTPDGRQYKFDNVKRFQGGRVSQQTKIVNYPVQGYATGTLVPLACIRARRKFKGLGLKSLLIITVHDSIVVDVYPGEKQQVVEALCWAMRRMPEEAHQRWGHRFVLPLAIEAESGKNWMTMNEVELPEAEPLQYGKEEFEDEICL